MVMGTDAMFEIRNLNKYIHIAAYMPLIFSR